MLADGVVDEAKLTTLNPWGDSVQANVELGAILCVGVLGMGIGQAEAIFSGFHFGALESTLSNLGLAFTFLSLGICGPVANTLVFVEPQTGRASVFFGNTVNAGVKNIAHGRIWMGVEAVQTWAEVIQTPGRLKLKTITAVDVEVVIARFPLAAERVEDETIGTQSLFWYTIKTVVIFITLYTVFKKTVPFGTLERLCAD